ncbi:MAG: cell division ATPase MinD [archaeon]
MPKIIGIVSGKGGTGKTVSSINIALALHQFGEEVVVVDADTTASSLGLHLGFYTFPNKLQDVLNDEIDINRAIYMHHTGLKLIPSSIDLDSLSADVSRLRLVLNKLEGTIILDAPPGLDKDSRTVLDACDEIIIVTNPEIPTVANAVKVARVATDMKKNVLGILITRMKYSAWELRPEEIEMMCEVPVIGIIPEDWNVSKSIFDKVPIVAQSPYSHASIEYKKLAARLIGKTYEPPRYLGLKKFLKMI